MFNNAIHPNADLKAVAELYHTTVENLIITTTRHIHFDELNPIEMAEIAKTGIIPNDCVVMDGCYYRKNEFTIPCVKVKNCEV